MKRVTDLSLEELQRLVEDVQSSYREGQTFGSSTDISNDIGRILHEFDLDVSEVTVEDSEITPGTWTFPDEPV